MVVLKDSPSTYHRFPILTNKSHTSLLHTSAPYPTDRPSQLQHRYTLARGPTVASSLVAFRNLRRPLQSWYLPFHRHTIPTPHCLLIARNPCITDMDTLLRYMKRLMAGQATDRILDHTATTCIPRTITDYPSCTPPITLLHIRPLCLH